VLLALIVALELAFAALVSVQMDLEDLLAIGPLIVLANQSHQDKQYRKWTGAVFVVEMVQLALAVMVLHLERNMINVVFVVVMDLLALIPAPQQTVLAALQVEVVVGALITQNAI